MKYQNIVKGKFISRPNRFVAHVEIDGEEKICHVKNTGRCAELLVLGATVYLEDFTGRMGMRKLQYSLIAVEKMLGTASIDKIVEAEATDKTDRTDKTDCIENIPYEAVDYLLINMDSQAPNKVAGEALADGRIALPDMGPLEVVKPEVVYGNSRLDFYVKDVNGNEGYVEVKGVTLENDGHATFPDAPTERGIKHLHELIGIRNGGIGNEDIENDRIDSGGTSSEQIKNCNASDSDFCNAYVLFVIQMSGMKSFSPNDERHKAFGDALRASAKTGVHILAYECAVTPNSLEITVPVKIDLR